MKFGVAPARRVRHIDGVHYVVVLHQELQILILQLHFEFQCFEFSEVQRLLLPSVDAASFLRLRHGP